MRLAAVRPTWRHFCSMDFKVKGSSACKALHGSNQWPLHTDRRVFILQPPVGTTAGLTFRWIDFTDILHPPREISRRLRAKRPKPFIYRSTPNFLPTPYMYKYAPHHPDVPISQIVLGKCHPQTGSSGFLVLGEKGEGKEKNRITTAMPFWWFSKGLNKLLCLNVFAGGVKCCYFFWK